MEKIGFVCKDDWCDELVVDLRKKGHTAQKISHDVDLHKYSALVIDLGYPGELAFKLLEQTASDYHFSETVFFVAISHKNQLNRLRSFAFGVDGYISPLISSVKLLKKINEINHSESHLPTLEVNQDVEVKYDCLLTHISESGAILKSKSMHESGKILEINGKLFKDMDIEEGMVSRVSRGNPLAKKSYFQQIDFADIVPANSEKIRKMILNWEAK